MKRNSVSYLVKGSLRGALILSLTMLSVSQMALADKFQALEKAARATTAPRVTSTLSGLVNAASEGSTLREFQATLAGIEGVGAAGAAELVAANTTLRVIHDMVQTAPSGALVQDLKKLQEASAKSPLEINDLMAALETIKTDSLKNNAYAEGTLAANITVAAKGRIAQEEGKKRLANKPQTSEATVDISYRTDKNKRAANARIAIQALEGGLVKGEEDAERVAGYFMGCKATAGCEVVLSGWGEVMTGIDEMKVYGVTPSLPTDLKIAGIKWTGVATGGQRFEDTDGSSIHMPVLPITDVDAHFRFGKRLGKGLGLLEGPGVSSMTTEEKRELAEQVGEGALYFTRTIIGFKGEKPTRGAIKSQLEGAICWLGGDEGAKLDAYTALRPQPVPGT